MYLNVTLTQDVQILKVDTKLNDVRLIENSLRNQQNWFCILP